MSTITFIIWPVSADNAFRGAYEATTGEVVQQNPDIDATGGFYMIGTSRATPDDCLELQQTVSTDILYGTDPALLGWAPFIETE